MISQVHPLGLPVPGKFAWTEKRRRASENELLCYENFLKFGVGLEKRWCSGDMLRKFIDGAFDRGFGGASFCSG